jgi:TfoX/Sxy family transcriptional regulator of competence genes
LFKLIPPVERVSAIHKAQLASINGNMFSTFSKDGRVGLRLGKEEREVFIEKYDSKLFENYGLVMKEYVEVPDSLLDKLNELTPYLEQSYAYAKTLKPKPTKKKPK